MKIRFALCSIPLLALPVSAMAWVAPFPTYTAPAVPSTVVPFSVKHTSTSVDYPLAAQSAGGVTQIGIGTATGNAGFGDVKLGSALSLILPPIWTSNVSSGLDKTKVSWDGGTWLHALNHIGEKSGILFTVNWNTLEVSAEDGAQSPQIVSSTVGGLHVAPESTALASTALASTAPAAAVAAPSFEPVETWSLNKNTLILPDLQKWASKSGWAIVWKTKKDWSVPNTTVYTGDFSKAVIGVVKDLNYDGAAPALHYKVWNNNNTITIWQ